ncbi:MAG TPA: AbrB/MazE/SpoVT family DNA-binding domain-containing protein [Thermoanaerobaculia bacterium]|nr:AbrB/MazE/SpoVT family DNA-binding domain-containing protein [Thermoanaerobaculia bacterium]
MTSKGQITIPKEIRVALGLRAGSRLFLRMREDGVVEISSETVDLMSLCGILKPAVRGVTLENLEAAIRDGAAGEESESGNSMKQVSKGAPPPRSSP